MIQDKTYGQVKEKKKKTIPTCWDRLLDNIDNITHPPETHLKEVLSRLVVAL